MGTRSGAGLSKNTFLQWEAAALSPLWRQVTEPLLCKARASLFFPNNVIIRQLHSCLSSSLSIIQNVEELGSVAAPLPGGSVRRNTPLPPVPVSLEGFRHGRATIAPGLRSPPEVDPVFTLYPKSHWCSPLSLPKAQHLWSRGSRSHRTHNQLFTLQTSCQREKTHCQTA